MGKQVLLCNIFLKLQKNFKGILSWIRVSTQGCSRSADAKLLPSSGQKGWWLYLCSRKMQGTDCLTMNCCTKVQLFLEGLTIRRKYSNLIDINSLFISYSNGVEYRNCHQTLDVYLLFAILLGEIKSKVSYKLVTYKLASP